MESGLTYDSGTYRGVCVGFRSWSGSPESRYVWGSDGPNMIRRRFLELAGTPVLSPLFADTVPKKVRTERHSVSRERVYDLRLYQVGSGRVHIQFLELRAAVSVESWDDAYTVAQYIDDVVTDFSPELKGESVYRFQIRGNEAVLYLDRWMIVYRVRLGQSIHRNLWQTSLIFQFRLKLIRRMSYCEVWSYSDFIESFVED